MQADMIPEEFSLNVVPSTARAQSLQNGDQPVIIPQDLSGFEADDHQKLGELCQTRPHAPDRWGAAEKTDFPHKREGG
jgi:hypothetical protein